jgi:hypothetical protein
LFWNRERGLRCAFLKKLRWRDATISPQEELVARFEIRDRFLSDDELRCYRLLCDSIGDRAIVCLKPRVLEALRVLDAHEHLQDALRVDRKHLDFLICSDSTGHPLCAVQIDWWNEDKSEFRPREQILEQAFEHASFPVLYVPSNQLPAVDALRADLERLVGSDSEGKLFRIDRPDKSVSRADQVCQTDVKKS